MELPACAISNLVADRVASPIWGIQDSVSDGLAVNDAGLQGSCQVPFPGLAC